MSSDSRELVSSFEALASSLKQLHDALAAGSSKHWLLDSPEATNAFHDAIKAVTNIWYQNKGDGRCTQNSYGLIGVPPSIIPLIIQANQAKKNFQKVVKLFTRDKGRPAEILHKRAKLLASSLERTGLARLHLKQCYRQIPLLEHTPKKVSLNWYSNGRSIRKLTIADAEKRLMKMDYSKTHIQMQLEALARLDSGEVLAQLQPQVPVMRANMIWQENGQKMRKARNCPLPLFFPLEDNADFPEHNEPPVEPPIVRQRQLRSDILIDPEVYLPSLRAHRYIKKS